MLLVGGRYGSLDEEGIGYTEKEYEYATRQKKPVIPLLHKSPDNLPRGKTETDPGSWKKLEEFRAKVEKKHTCAYWESAEDLKAKVIVGLTANVKRHPAVGWMRADNIPSDATVREVLALRKQLAELEEELKQIRTGAPPGTEDLMQGDDLYEIEYSFVATPPSGSRERTAYDATMNASWNEIFAGVAPVMINEASEHALRLAFHKHFEQLASQELNEDEDFRKQHIEYIRFRDNDIETCLIQFRALGMIKESDRKRSVKDTSTYWALTPYGDRMMVQLRALRRDPPAKRVPGGKPEAVAPEVP